jgi:hypothetical protein
MPTAPQSTTPARCIDEEAALTLEISTVNPSKPVSDVLQEAFDTLQALLDYAAEWDTTAAAAGNPNV